jgi:hypothetical protein
MSLELHEWDIHIVRRGADDASGTGISFPDGAMPPQAP